MHVFALRRSAAPTRARVLTSAFAAHAYVAGWNEQPGNWSIIGGPQDDIYAGD